MAAITITREYGSRGAAIAEQVARRLGWRYVDKDLTNLLLERAEIDEEAIRPFNQETFSLVRSFAADLVSMVDVVSPPLVARCIEGPDDQDPLPRPNAASFCSGRYLELMHRVIQAIAMQENVVIMGHGAHLILKDVPACLHVRFVSPWAVRVTTVASREGISPSDAARRIRQYDSVLARYLRHYYHVKGDDVHLYDVVLNTDRRSDEEIVRVIADTVRSMRASDTSCQDRRWAA